MMKRYLIIFLLIFLPLQFTWAAVKSYCAHENGNAAQHVGHHEHQHKAEKAEPSVLDPANFNLADPDCAACHTGCTSSAGVCITSSQFPNLSNQALNEVDYLAHLPSPLPTRPERPQWLIAA